MTALESFNALDNREVSRKEVEQVLTQAKAENNTAIIYRLSRVLNDSPEATHFEITITHYDSSVGFQACSIQATIAKPWTIVAAYVRAGSSLRVTW